MSTLMASEQAHHSPQRSSHHLSKIHHTQPLTQSSQCTQPLAHSQSYSTHAAGGRSSSPIPSSEGDVAAAETAGGDSGSLSGSKTPTLSVAPPQAPAHSQRLPSQNSPGRLRSPTQLRARGPRVPISHSPRLRGRSGLSIAIPARTTTLNEEGAIMTEHARWPVLPPEPGSAAADAVTLAASQTAPDAPNGVLGRHAAYLHGPRLVAPSSLYLYSEPDSETAGRFDVVVNVARDVACPLKPEQLDSVEYVFVPWDHDSAIVDDLDWLTLLLTDRIKLGKQVLVHCQCGVSRSASLVVAYVMRELHLGLSDAYNYVKERSPAISPNLELVSQIAEWGQLCGLMPAEDRSADDEDDQEDDDDDNDSDNDSDDDCNDDCNDCNDCNDNNNHAAQ